MSFLWFKKKIDKIPVVFQFVFPRKLCPNVLRRTKTMFSNNFIPSSKFSLCIYIEQEITCLRFFFISTCQFFPFVSFFFFSTFSWPNRKRVWHLKSMQENAAAKGRRCGENSRGKEE